MVLLQVVLINAQKELMEHRNSHPAFLARVFALALLGWTVLSIGCSPDDTKPIETNNLHIKFIGDNLKWSFVYPGEDLVLGNEDDVEINSRESLHIPSGSKITMHMTSHDYIYCLEIPELEKREVAIPDLDYRLVFETTGTNTLHLAAGQMCGLRNNQLDRLIIVDSIPDFQRWMQSVTTNSQSKL